MTDQVVTLRINADGRVAVQVTEQVAESTRRMGGEAERGGQRAARGMDEASKATERLAKEANSSQAAIIRLLAAAGGIAVVTRGTIAAADAYANINGRLRLATRSQQEYALAQSEVFAISQRTSSQLESTATLYARLSSATADANVSQRALLSIVETINQTFAISSATTQAQSNAIIQLSQAFAGGVLRAEEFNSIIENSERLARALADGLGVSTGALRKMVNDGEVTSARMIEALQSQAATIKEEFGAIPLTVGRAWTQLENTMLKSIGDLDQSLQVSTRIVDVLDAIAGNLDVVGYGVLALAVAYGTGTAAAALQAAAQRSVAASALAEAEAQVAKARVMAPLIGTTTALTAAELRLAEAQAAATAAGVGKVSMLGRMGNSLLALVGGPIGAAVLGIGGIGIALYGSIKAEREREHAFGEGLRKSVEETAGLTAEVHALTAALSNLKAPPPLEESIEKWTRASAELADKQAHLATIQRELDAAQNDLVVANAYASAGMDTMGIAASDAATRVERLAREHAALSPEVDKLANEMAQLNPAILALLPNLDQIYQSLVQLRSASSVGDVFAAFRGALAGVQAQGAQLAADANFQKAFGQFSGLVATSAAKLKEAKEATAEYRKELAATIIRELEASGASAERVTLMRQQLDAGLATINQAEALNKRTREQKDTAAEYVAQLRQQVAAYGLSATAAARVEAASKKLSDTQRGEVKALLDQLEAWEAITVLVERAADAWADFTTGNAALREELAQGRDRLAGLTDAQIEHNAALREANKLAEEALLLGPPTAEQQAMLAERLRLLSDLRQQSADIDAFTEATQRNQQAAQDWSRMWEQAGGDVAGLLGDVLTGQIETFDDFGDALLNIVQRTVSQIIAEYLRLQVINPMLNGLLGGSLPVGGGGGIGSLFGMGGAGGSGSAMGGLGAAGGWVAAIAALAMLNESAFSGGYRASNSSYRDMIDGGAHMGALSGGLIAPSLPIVSTVADRWLQGIGVDERWASRLTGSSLFARALGYADPKVTGTGYDWTFGNGGVGGEEWARIKQSGGWFRSDRRWTETEDLSSEMLRQIEAFWDAVRLGMEQIGRRFGADLPDMLEASFRAEYDKEGNLVRSVGTILGETYEEAWDVFSQRVRAENLIAALGATDVGTGASDIAERWRDDALALADGAQMMIAAADDIRRGAGLLGEKAGLGGVVDLVEELAGAGESLNDAYARLVESTRLYETLLSLTGNSFDGGREALVRFSDSIVEAAGGIDQARSLYESFAANYYSSAEMMALQAEQLREAAESALSGIGLDAQTSMGELRAALERMLATGASPDTIVTWLEAADALAQATAAQEAYTRALVEAQLSYIGTVSALEAELGRSGGLAGGLAEIKLWEASTTRALNDAARASGRYAASERDLALVREVAEQRRLQLIAQLESTVQSLVDQLYGSGADTAASWGGTVADQFGAVAAASDNLYERQIAGIRSVQEYLDAMVLGDLSPLSPRERLDEAMRQFLEAQRAALTGDVDAMARAQQLSDIYIRLLRQYTASGDDYNNGTDGLLGFWDIRDLLQQIANMSPTAPKPSEASGLGGAGASGNYGSVDEALEANRLALAQQLAGHLADLAQALNVPILELLAQRGVDLAELTRDLGINLRDITAESVRGLSSLASTLGLSLTELTGELGLQLTALGDGVRELAEQMGIDLSAMTIASTQSLADLARQLGVDLGELATSVGLDLGNLADAQGLLNQALAATIEGLPADQRDALAPLLEAIVNATDRNSSVAAIEALEAAVNAMSPDLRNLLAPYLEGVLPVDALDQLDYLTQIAASATSQLEVAQEHTRLLDRIANNLSAFNTAQGIPSYAVGTDYVPYDMLANIHAGEKIIDPLSSSILSRYGIRVTGGMGDTRALEVRLDVIAEEVRRIGARVTEGAQQVASTVDSAAARSDRQTEMAIDSLPEKINRSRGFS